MYWIHWAITMWSDSAIDLQHCWTTNHVKAQIHCNCLNVWLPGVHGVLVDVILADVDVSLALEVPHHHLLHVAQVPHGVAIGVLGTRFKRLYWERGNMDQVGKYSIVQLRKKKLDQRVAFKVLESWTLSSAALQLTICGWESVIIETIKSGANYYESGWKSEERWEPYHQKHCHQHHC